jgi:hypothetical protein
LRLTFFYLASFALASLHDRFLLERARGYETSESVINTLLFRPPNNLGRYTFPSGGSSTYSTKYGITITLPEYGFAAPLISAETLYPGWENLRFNREGDPRFGFHISPPELIN